MANLTKDEVATLAQRAFDIKLASVELANNAIKESKEYKDAVENYTHPVLEAVIKYEQKKEELDAIRKRHEQELEEFRNKIRQIDPAENVVSTRWLPDSESVKNNLLRKEVFPKFPLQTVGSHDKFMNKLKSVAVMNKAKTPTEVLEILLMVESDEQEN